MCNASRKIGNNVINKRLTGLSSSCCFGRGGSIGRVQGVRPPPGMTCGFLMWFIGVEVEQETSAPPPKKNPGSAPVW